MSFASRIKGKEMACIVRILEIFGVVEQRQMRELFSRLSDEAYGKILSHLISKVVRSRLRLSITLISR